MLFRSRFLGAEFREGRAEVAPQRKEHERIICEDIDWQLAETARDDIDDEEAELRLARECEECQGEHGHGESNREVEELMQVCEEIDFEQYQCDGHKSEEEQTIPDEAKAKKSTVKQSVLNVCGDDAQLRVHTWVMQHGFDNDFGPAAG